jgi:hypothetical protein
MKHNRFLNLPLPAQMALIAAARDQMPVNGLTHNYYRYPARFSPTFVRAAIETFTSQGDVILDPHVGGGTTLVEALALGRHAIGVDISSLAEFVASVKTTVYSDAEITELMRWTARLPSSINIHRPSFASDGYAEDGYHKHLDTASRWRLRKAIEQAIASAKRLRSPRLEFFGRCVALRTAQWALDGRKTLPTVAQIRAKLEEYAVDMIAAAERLRAAVECHPHAPEIHVLNRSAVGLETEHIFTRMPKPRLVLTSPPYPGVHVLYHRWQVDGRKEAPAPFWIANKLDGAGGSYYTMGDRKCPELRTYFENIHATMSSVAELTDSQTTMVQVVAFSEPTWQLPRDLDTLDAAGFRELKLPALRGEGDGRLWRTIPNRKWHANQKGQTPSSKEVILFLRR